MKALVLAFGLGLANFSPERDGFHWLTAKSLLPDGPLRSLNEAFAQVTEAERLFAAAKSGSRAAIRQLSELRDPAVPGLLDQLAAIYPNDQELSVERCVAKAAAGDQACAIRLADQVLWGAPGPQTRALEAMPLVDRGFAFRVFRLALDEQYTPSPDHDLLFLSPAAIAIELLPSLVTGTAQTGSGRSYTEARPQWIRYSDGQAPPGFNWNVLLSDAVTRSAFREILTIGWLEASGARPAAAKLLVGSKGDVATALAGLLARAGDAVGNRRLFEVAGRQPGNETAVRALYLLRTPQAERQLCWAGTPLAAQFLYQLHPQIFDVVPGPTEIPPRVRRWCKEGR
jgi:hypothetical protein